MDAKKRNMIEMTNEVAIELINLFKKIAKGILIIPSNGKMEYEFHSTNTRDKFKVSIYRNMNASKVTYIGLHRGTNIPLVRLDITPNGKHTNPDGQIIEGNHLHIYSEKYGDKFAVNFNENDNDVLQNCLSFFDKFNIIKPEIVQEFNLFS